MKKTRIKYLRIVTLALTALVVILLGAFWILPDKSYSDRENRMLQRFPELSWSQLTSGRFESLFEDYVADQFPARNLWIQLKTTVDRLLGKVESNGVFLSGDGYLMQTFTEPDEANYQETVAALRNFSSWHPQLRQTLMIVPSAISIYRELLPANAPTGDENAFIDRFVQDLSGCPMTFVDVREVFQASKGDVQLYYRTDHHWTTPGAYIAYRVFAETMGLEGRSMAYTPTLLTNAFSGTLTATSGFRMGETDDLYAYLPVNGVSCVITYPGQDGRYASPYFTEQLANRDKYQVFFQGNHPQVNIETGAESKRVMLVLKDSYANCFVPFLTEDYKKIIMIDPRYYTGDLETLIDSEGVTDMLMLYNASTLSQDASLKADL